MTRALLHLSHQTAEGSLYICKVTRSAVSGQHHRLHPEVRDMCGKALLLLCTAFFGCHLPWIALAAVPDATVSVTGTGSSVDAAKADAIRQALQKVVKQLVVVDRAV